MNLSGAGQFGPIEKTLEIKGLNRIAHIHPDFRSILLRRGRVKKLQTVAFFVRRTVAIAVFAAHSERKSVVPSLQAASRR